MTLWKRTECAVNAVTACNDEPSGRSNGSISPQYTVGTNSYYMTIFIIRMGPQANRTLTITRLRGCKRRPLKCAPSCWSA